VTPDEKKQVVRDVIAAIDAQDMPTLQAHPGLHETIVHMPHLWASLANLSSVIDHITVEDDMVATVVSVTGAHVGSFVGEPPSGQEITFLVVGMDRVEDGKITLHYAVPDVFPFLTIARAASTRRARLSPSQ